MGMIFVDDEELKELRLLLTSRLEKVSHFAALDEARRGNAPEVKARVEELLTKVEWELDSRERYAAVKQHQERVLSEDAA